MDHILKSTKTPDSPAARPGAYDHDGTEVQRRKLADQASTAFHKKVLDVWIFRYRYILMCRYLDINI